MKPNGRWSKMIEIIPDHPHDPNPDPLAFCEWDRAGETCLITILDHGSEVGSVFGAVRRSRGIFVSAYRASLASEHGVQFFPSTPSMISAVGFILEPYLPENIERIRIREK